jgi:hypothetical protein
MVLTESINLQTGQGKVIFEQLVDIVCAYIALAIRDFKKLVPQLPELSPRLIELTVTWSEVVKWETSAGFDEMRRAAYRMEFPDEVEESPT